MTTNFNFETGARQTGLHAVDGSISEAGRVIFYRLNGSASEADIERACDNVLMRKADRPKMPEAKSILSRSLEDLRKRSTETKRCLKRPLEDGGAYALVTETVDGDELSYSTGLKAFIDKDTRQLVITPDYTNQAQALREEFDRQRRVLSANDISKWIVQSLDRIEAASLRDRGGVYFVPNHQLGEWAKIVSVVNEATNHVMHEIPAMPSEKTVEAILDSLTREATTLVDQVESDIKENQELAAGEKKLHGKRSLKTKVNKLERMRSKLASYDKVLGIKLPEIDTNLTNVRANVVLHAIALEAEVDAEREARQSRGRR